MNRMIVYSLLLLTFLVVLKLLVWYVEPKLAFYPFAGVQETPRDLGIEFSDLSIVTSDGERLSAWWLEPRDALAEVVYFHGNGGNLSNWLPIVAAMHARRLAVLAVDYRGYGASSGAPSEQGLYRDADATLDRFWRELHRAGRPVIYWGRSLGGAPATYGAKVRRPDGVILEAPFPDKNAVVAGNPLLRVLGVFSSYRFPMREFLGAYEGPALVIHGDADTIVDPSLGRQVFDALKGPKTLVLIPGADHNDLHDVDPNMYWDAIETFLRSLRGS